jgi:hypothetical protein
MNGQRNGYARGTRPARPGDLTARIFNENQRKIEAAKRTEKDSDPFRDGYTAGWSAGFDTGFERGAERAFDLLENAGIDVDGVLETYNDSAGETADDDT